ncbi:hypothetical protein 05601_47 [Lactococcus phage 05601]|uniref:Uncharacterized protein n=1 Tax=Lactococcus phage 05601 TaxID=2029658 RepID=A0A343JNL6_9CAUD|nr:hypothetical protein HYP24_gp47 [Lactococcus phage 05601]ASZ71089.1 hypothetical protein 05601_47 [Lactococcus phage 05601]
MVVKLTQKQDDYLKTFKYDKKLALYHISRWGFGYKLKDGNEKVYVDNEEPPFAYDEKEKMLNALINGYEVVVTKFKFHTFSDISGLNRLYYNGVQAQLTTSIERAKEVEKNSEEYMALENLGFFSEEV